METHSVTDLKSSNRRILVVDDNQAIHDDFRKIFNVDGTREEFEATEEALFGDVSTDKAAFTFELDFASQGAEGLALVAGAVKAGRPYAMAFMDVRMPPGLDGIETSAKIWEIDPDLQIAFCTAYSDYSWEKMTAQLGNLDNFVILKKPFEIIEVLQLANAFTEKWNLSWQRREDTRRLQESKQRYEFLTNAVPSIVWTARPDGNVDYANKWVLEYCGLGMEQFKNAGWQRALHPEDALLAIDLWTRCFRAGSVYETEYRLKRAADGAYRWHLARALPMRDGEGKIVQWIGTGVDINDQKLAEEVLRQSQADLEKRVEIRTAELQQAVGELAYERDLLRALMENSPDHIYFKDLNSRFLRCSKTLVEKFGVSRMEDIVGKTDQDIFGEARARPSFDDEQEIIRTGQPIAGKVEQEVMKGSDQTVWVLTDKLPFRNREGKIVGTFGISKNITALKQAEQTRQTMEVQLRQAQKLEAVGQLAAGIAHEINTPIQYVGDNTRFLKDSFGNIAQVLKTYDELLQAVKAGTVTPELLTRLDEAVVASDLNYLFEQIPAAIRETLEGIERVTKIVRAMKEFSHPGSKEKTAADLNKAIETTMTVAHNEWKYVADMALDLDPDLPTVPCFLGEFNQVILNLIVNAAHAIGDVVKDHPGTKGTISVRTRRDGDSVEVRVSDTGTGIPESARPRIFEPFFTTKDVGKGTGQGLSIVYSSIVKKHGGTARFETEVGKGTTFILRLPIAAPVSNSEPRVAEKSLSARFTTDPSSVQPVSQP